MNIVDRAVTKLSDNVNYQKAFLGHFVWRPASNKPENSQQGKFEFPFLEVIFRLVGPEFQEPHPSDKIINFDAAKRNMQPRVQK